MNYDYFDMMYPVNNVSYMRYNSLLITEFSDTKIHSFTCLYSEDIRNFGTYIKSTILSLINSYQWNYNQLLGLFNDSVCAESILYLEDLIHPTYDNYD